MARASSTFSCRSRSTMPIRTARRTSSASRSAISWRCRSGPREALGVVWADNVAVQPGLHNRLKDVEAKLDYPPLREELRRFVDWVSNYTLSPRGMVLRMTLRMGDLGPERERVAVRLAGPPPQRLTPARRRVLDALADGLLRTKSEAAKDAGVSAGVIDGLVDEGTLEVVALPPEPVARQPDPDYRDARAHRPAAHGGRHPARRGAAGRLRGRPARRRHRLGQDRGLFRGDRRDDPQGPPVAGPDARDRAHRAVPRSLRAALRHAPGRMAFGARRRASARAPGARSRPAR